MSLSGTSTSFQSGNGWPAGTASPIGGTARPYNSIGKEMGMEWKDQYKHPNWQRKRLEALEAAEFMCQRCCDSESQLHVHHKQYIKGRKIWEYEILELAVLCEPCHEEAHAIKDAFSQILLRLDPNAVDDAAAMLAAFCTHVGAPYFGDCSDIVALLDNAYGEVVGKVAAAIANRYLGIQAMLDFAKRVEAAKPGDDVCLHLPEPKNSAGDGLF